MGTLHVITGPMFAGKTASLIRVLAEHRAAGRTVDVFTHAIDTRRRAGEISTHDGDSLEAHAVPTADDLLGAVRSTEIIAVDEAQFFGQPLTPVVARLLRAGQSVILAGLCVTYDGQPFDPIPALMALADRVDKLVARCDICGAPAPYHQPVKDSKPGDPLTIRPEQVGGASLYEARCRRHFTNAAPAAL